ncbi:hypothetical protein VTN00DRAFT_7668 [Thermoascus crustaceus]|uniref:uncharacterized protein n=1 Tax=Thermoascus crustaceus TaxID=5088 RepID=UPI0037433263
MFDPTDIEPNDYGMSVQNGFLPERQPLQRLPDPYYNKWEDLTSDLPKLIQMEKIRQEIDSLPILSTSGLHQEQEWQRAYVLLAFLAHAYIWGGDKPKDILPPSISCPFLQVSSHLELPPCATYAAVCLWNYKTLDPDIDISQPDNLAALVTFTGTTDEEWFFCLSVAIEARGGKVVPMMRKAIDAVEEDDPQHVTELLNRFTECLKDLCGLLERMYEKCAPAVFYHKIRPFLAGSKNMAAAGLPKGVFYDLGDGIGEWLQYSGGSNAQSSLIQLFDIFLGVEHFSEGETKSNTHQSRQRHAFIQDMRSYMPGPHRRFLKLLAQISNIRPYAMSHKADSNVRGAYNAAVLMLRSFRDVHIQIVARYIIAPAQKAPSQGLTEKRNLATASSGAIDSGTNSLCGTGGTSLIPFLRKTRDETRDAANYSD